MKNMKLIGLSVLILSSSVLIADKPEWAGNGGKPSKYEKESHKNEMKSKHKYKKDKHHKKNDDHDYDGYNERDRDLKYENDKSYRGTSYEGQGQTDGEFIEKKTDETKKNWIGKFFDFLN